MRSRDRTGSLPPLTALAATAVLAVTALPPLVGADAHADTDPRPGRPTRAPGLYTPPAGEEAYRHLLQLVQRRAPRDAAGVLAMIRTPRAVWLGDQSPAEVESQVRATTRAAARQGVLPVLALYDIPGRDCGNYSAGGAPDSAAYRSWIDAVARGIGDRPVLVVLEPDALALLPQDCPDTGSWYDSGPGRDPGAGRDPDAGSDTPDEDWFGLGHRRPGGRDWPHLGDSLNGLGRPGWRPFHRAARGGTPGRPDRRDAAPADPFRAEPADWKTRERYAELNYAVDVLEPLPGTRVYLDAGHSAWHRVPQIVPRLLAGGVSRASGFFVNVSGYQSDEANVWYGRLISSCLAHAARGGDPAACPTQDWPRDRAQAWLDAHLGTLDPARMKHFVTDTSRNGRGPWTPPPARHSDPQDWCNPPGRGLGARPTLHTPDPLQDAALWVKTPGESDGQCLRGAGGPEDPERGTADPAPGRWFPAQALELVRLARPDIVPEWVGVLGARGLFPATPVHPDHPAPMDPAEPVPPDPPG
ncbi:hypothetical protein ACZ90_01130 [Streptomyces albus subsp. albus]|nr:hypothetical protein ACZ90_01130 [Streptomyces albus subsp. albus]